MNRAVPRSVALLVAAVWLALASPVPAAAHDDVLVGSVPAAGAVLAEAPAELGLAFGADLAAIEPLVLVRTADGSSVAAGPPVVVGRDVTQPLRAGLADGSYAVTWRVVVSDGHVFSGTFAFAVGEAVPAPAGPDPAELETAVPGPADPAGGAPPAGLLAAMGASLVALFLVPALLFRRKRPGQRPAAPTPTGEAP